MFKMKLYSKKINSADYDMIPEFQKRDVEMNFQKIFSRIFFSYNIF